MNARASKLIGALVAASASIGVLAYSADGWRADEGIAASPFGWYRVMVVHALAALPLAWAIADTAAMRVPLLGQRRLVGVWIVLGVAAGLAGLAAGPFVGEALDTVGAGFVPRLVLRTCWCVALQVAWFLAARGLGSTSSESIRRPAAQLNLFALSLVVALAMPASYLDKLIDEQTKIATRHWGEDHFLRAWKITVRLCDLGSARGLGDSQGGDSQGGDSQGGDSQGADSQGAGMAAPRVARRRLLKNVETARREIDRLEGLDRDDRQRRLLAGLLAAVDRLEEAKAEIEPLAGRKAEAALTLARFLQEQRHWRQSNRHLLAAIDLARADRSKDAAVLEENAKIQRRAYDALVFNERHRNRGATADRFYFEAIERLPDDAAYFHYGLGRHYELEGRPRLAVEHFEKAHALDRTYERPAGVLTRILSNNTPVGLFSPSASSHK